MLNLVARALSAVIFAAAVFAGVALLTVPATLDAASRWAPSASILKGARDFLAQNAPDGGTENAEVLTVQIDEDTIQDGTTSVWGGGATNYQVPRYVRRKYLKITSKSDEITINDIEINRGNCKPFMLDSWKPVSLRFGESTNISIICDPIEAKIDTNRGTYTFTW